MRKRTCLLDKEDREFKNNGSPETFLSKAKYAKQKYYEFDQAIMPKPLPGHSFAKKNIKMIERSNNPDCPYNNFVAIAAAHFNKMQEEYPDSCGKKEIESIDLTSNPLLEARFIAKKREFKEIGVSSREILAFHGTKSENVDSILESNLNQIKRPHYGNGYYFSEFPNISLHYAGFANLSNKDGLILFRVLPGKAYEDFQGCGSIPKGYHSKKLYINSAESVVPGDGGMVLATNRVNNKRLKQNNVEAYAKELVVPTSEQFMPFIVYHLK